MVLNDTKVIKARLHGQKQTGGAVEVLIERILPDEINNNLYKALCHVRSSRSPKVGQTLNLANNQMQATVIGRQDNLFILGF